MEFAATFGRRDWETDVSGSVAFAVVGLGGYARRVSLPAIAASDYGRVGAVVSGDETKRERVAAEYDAAAVSYESYAEGTASDAYDAVYVATPNRMHLPHVETAAEHGAHVICEKPLDATIPRAQRAVERCADAGVRLMTAYRMQCDPVVRRLRSILADGRIGDPVKLFGDFTFPVLAGGGPDQWRLDPALAGGGALFDVGVYPLNTARFLLDAEPVAVDAAGGLPAQRDGTDSPAGTGGDDAVISEDSPAETSGDDTKTGDGDDGETNSDPFDEVDEHTHFRVVFPDAVGNFSASFSGYGSSRLEVIGTDGRITIDNAFVPDGDRRVSIETADGRVRLDGAGADETREEFDYFAHAILADTPIEPDGQDGLTDMRAMEAVYDAADRGERVEL